MTDNALNCRANFLGSGQGACVIEDLGDMLGFLYLNQSGTTKWDNNNPLTRQTYLNALKSLNAFPYLTRHEFTENTPDNETNTSTSGLIKSVRQGKPLYQFTYTKGRCTHESLYNKRNKYFQAGLIFETGVLFTKTVDGYVRGFNASPLNVETYRFQSGTDLERSIVNIQLSKPDELNANSVFYSWEELGFDMTDINGVIDVTLEVVGNPSGSDEIQVKAVSRCNKGDFVPTLDDKDFWSVTGKTVSTVTYDSETGIYTLGLNSALDTSGKVTVKLHEGTYDVVEDLSGALFKGSTVVDLTPISA